MILVLEMMRNWSMDCLKEYPSDYGSRRTNMFLRKRACELITCSIFVLSLSSLTFSQETKEKKAIPDGTPILWQEPADLASRNLLLGPGGQAMQPDLSQGSFIKEEKGGYSTKYRVRDGAGREWVAKIGKEAQPEVAASRLLWAIGYFTEITYLVPCVEIEGKGTFENVRYEARPEQIKRLGEWKWDGNPFLGTPEFQGLKVMMLLLGNWDIKDANNLILLRRDETSGSNQLLYVISDLGATFGKTEGLLTGSRNKPEDYVKDKFIKGVKDNRVEFDYGGKRGEIFRDITVEQARWVGTLLSRLSEEQIKDAFRAANYTEDQLQTLTGAVRKRIHELVTLTSTAAKERKREQ
jgi:hypothetical protein